MKMKMTILVILTLGFILPGEAQEDKNPVAENDYAATRILQTIEIPVLENDYAYDGHPFKISAAYGGNQGIFYKTDSTIFYTPQLSYPYYFGVDSITYYIIDLENNLFSELAKVYIEITNEGFDMLDINRVSCRINAYGLQFWDMDYMNNNIKYEVPAGSGISTIFNQTLWVAGLDEAGDLHVAAERYRQVGADFYSGPMMDSLSYSNELDVLWHKVWKLSAAEVAFHRQNWQQEGYVPVENIARWPANGDVSSGQAEKLAPYYDWDGDGNYNPENGDFPLIKGDQAVFVMTNDDRGPHLESEGDKFGIEIQTFYYAYDNPNDSALKYTTFADQHIINRSMRSYHDVFIGNFIDFDLGFYIDDYLHCDTALQSAICYNGEATDGQGDAGEYGGHPPAQSFTCLNYKMDGFAYFLNWGAPQPMLDPETDKEYYNYLRGFWRDSTHFTYGDDGYGGEMPVKYLFTGDPVTGTGWTELDSPFGPGDRRGLISSGPYVLNPGDTLHLESALVYARDFQGDNLSSLALLKTRIQEVHEFYQNSLGIIDKKTSVTKIDVYPNPCRSEFFVDISKADLNKPVDYLIVDMPGREVQRGKITPGGIIRINISSLQPGIYLVKFIDGQASMTRKLIKEDR